MLITLQIETGNAAFDESNAGHEVARILKDAADKVETWPGANSFTIGLLDVNGNKVGSISASD